MPGKVFPALAKWRKNTGDQSTARVRSLLASSSVIGLDNCADYVIDSSVWFIPKHQHMFPKESTNDRNYQ